MSRTLPRISLSELLADAGVSPRSTIRLAGPGGASALIWLCTHGFDHVGHVRSLRGRALDGCDVLIMTHACDAFELQRTLHLAARLRPGATFITPLHPDLQGAGAAVARLFENAGFVAERHVMGHRAAFAIARRVADFRKAA